MQNCLELKNIYIFSRREIENWIKELFCPYIESKWALISIWADSRLIELKTVPILEKLGCQANISVRFDDITADSPSVGQATQSGRKFILFDEVHARNIINFTNAVKGKVVIIVVHCAAGVSRSGAVGLWMCRYLGLKESEYLFNNRGIMPNYYVINKLSDVSGIKKEWEKILKPRREFDGEIKFI